MIDKLEFAILYLSFYHNSESVEMGSFPGGFPTSLLNAPDDAKG